jgi:hypothetical protein
VKNLDEVEQAYFRRIVADGGGVYVGIQEGLAYDLVLFNSPKTGTTLALKYPITSTRVREHIQESNRRWGRT